MIPKILRPCFMAACAVGAIACGLPASALAHEGEFAQFDYCPSTTTGVFKCLHSVTNTGTIVLGNKTTPIVNPVTLQGGYSKEGASGFSTFYAATGGGETLTKDPQPVPGGLLGIVPPESAPPLVKAALAFFFENGLTGVNATLELAEPASDIELSSYNLEIGEEIALKLPVRIHLENPFLGSSCYVGSSTTPIIWNLTSGTTSPPGSVPPITGKPGYVHFTHENEILELTHNELVDNTWAAPEATGCGGLLSALVDPVINATIGLPATAGTNSATLENTIATATTNSVNEH
jgi:hypothetical protein